MKRKLITLAIVLGSTIFAYGSPEYYKINVNRIGDNLYRETHTDMIVVTRYCDAILVYEDVLLQYDFASSVENKMIYDEGRSYCQVVDLRE